MPMCCSVGSTKERVVPCHMSRPSPPTKVSLYIRSVNVENGSNNSIKKSDREKKKHGQKNFKGAGTDVP